MLTRFDLSHCNEHTGKQVSVRLTQSLLQSALAVTVCVSGAAGFQLVSRDEVKTCSKTIVGSLLTFKEG